MAPDIALNQVEALAQGAVVLDPMVGSGTVLRVAAECRHEALGFDLDPLAVLMARVWTTPLDPDQLTAIAKDVVSQIRQDSDDMPILPWVDDDPETSAFVDFWFAKPQQADLRRLSTAILNVDGPVGDALRLTLSSLIVTKDRGASLARDCSHSRPHRVRTVNDFSVPDEFLRAASRLASRLRDQPPPGGVSVNLGDARRLDSVASDSVDAVITSPPYLNAIDYLRGHRLALVWLGYRLSELRSIRNHSIGSETQPRVGSDLALALELTAPLSLPTDLPHRVQKMVNRFVLDLLAMLKEVRRVLRAGGKAVFVIGNSCVRGVFIKNSAALISAATMCDLRLTESSERTLPANRRYLPPPDGSASTTLQKRMRTESVLSFTRS